MKSTKIRDFVSVLFIGFVAIFTIISIRTLKVDSKMTSTGGKNTVYPTTSTNSSMTPISTINPDASRTTTPGVITDSNIPNRTAGAGTIVETSLSPFPGSTMGIWNNWYVDLNGKRIRVFAGARTGDGAKDLPKPWQGIVYVDVSGVPPDFTLYPKESGEYDTPDKVGPVRIMDANGMTLTLLAADEQHAYYFDVSTRQFLSQHPALPLSRNTGAGVLLESSLPQVTTSGFSTIQNQWSEIKNGQKITVIAGQKTGDDQGGDFDVIQTSQDGKTVLATTTYHTILGPLRLYDVNGEVIRFIGSAYIFAFDLNSRQFTSLPEFPPDFFVTPQSTPQIPTRVPPGTITPTQPTPTFAPYPYP
jgi:hypothetical protein